GDVDPERVEARGRELALVVGEGVVDAAPRVVGDAREPADGRAAEGEPRRDDRLAEELQARRLRPVTRRRLPGDRCERDQPAGADLTDEAEVDALFAAAGPLDVCAAVAGVWPAEDVPVWELPLERWEATLRANLTVTFLTARGFLRGVASRGNGSLVLVGSTA